MSDTDNDSSPPASYSWIDYVNSLCHIHHLTLHQFTQRIGASASVSTKWKEGGTVRAGTALTIAREFNIPYQEVLIAAELAEPSDFDYKGSSQVLQLAALPNDTLIEILKERLIPDEERDPTLAKPAPKSGDLRRRRIPVEEPPRVARRRTNGK
ncbi:hypothetical protein [Nocardia flavorosea]|uniref:Uncharacterized protein n=1 Tax=Nocardia flavorosea TaxID=53429 RepID=A0A846YPV9_9NOCA|nr:hypothetical protein [Nocardia flavorosea]NKY60803.1 hypothetical protein [Nocardia flavorosea]